MTKGQSKPTHRESPWHAHTHTHTTSHVSNSKSRSIAALDLNTAEAVNPFYYGVGNELGIKTFLIEH